MKTKPILIYSIITFLLTYLIYILTTAPGLTFTDSGELAAVCSTLGIAHPTGYPLFTILGHIWCLLPLPFKAVYSLNLFAGFLTAASATVFLNLMFTILQYLSQIKMKTSLSKKKSKHKQQKIKINSIELNNYQLSIIAIITALTYGFAKTIWEQAVAIEVYSLHLLMMNLILLFVVKAIFFDNKKYLLLGALFLGMSFANHMTTILLLPAILFIFFKRPNESFSIDKENLKLFVLLAIPFLIGLSFYLYLPLRAAQQPDFNWGWVSRSFDKFLYHVSGKQYQVWMFSDPDIWKENLVKFFAVLPFQIAWIGIIPLFYGAIICFKKSKELFIFILIFIISCITYSINYSIHDIESYFVTGYLGFIIFMGIGIWGLTKKLPNALLSFFLLPIAALILNYNHNDRSDDYIVEEYTRILLQKLEPNAIIISSQWDYWCSAFWYLQKVEGLRTDVVLIEKEILRRTWYLEQVKNWYPTAIGKCSMEMNKFLIDLEQFESGNAYNNTSIQFNFINMINCFIDKNFAQHPIYLTLDIIENEQDIAKNYKKIATGLAFRLANDEKEFPVTTEDLDFSKFIESVKSNDGHLVDGIKNTVAISLVNTGRYLLMSGDREQAKLTFQQAWQIAPNNEFVKNAMMNISSTHQ